MCRQLLLSGLEEGGNWSYPGEISLVHHGLLFLDELPEFGMRVLEVLRQPPVGFSRSIPFTL
jgi:predicted ATPase with chaperone activity